MRLTCFTPPPPAGDGKKQKTMKTTKEKIFAYSYNSVTEFVNSIKDKEVNPLFQGVEASLYESKYYTKFSSTENFTHAQNLLKLGDTDNMKKLSAAGLNVGTVKSIGSAPRVQRYNSVVGFCPNVARYLQGAPDNMINVRRKIFKTSKVINVFFNISVCYKTNAKVIIQTNAAFVNALLALESKGYRVNLYAGESSCVKDEYFICAVKIKDSATFFDKKKIAYPLVNPSFLRRHMFRALETSGVTYKDWQNSYGYRTTKNDNKTIKTGLQKVGVKCDTIVSLTDIIGMSSQEILDTCFANRK